MPVALPLDRIREVWPAELRNPALKLGAVLHQASVNRDLRHSLDILREHDNELFSLAALFGPQHGFAGTTQDNMIEWEGFQHPVLDIPVYSLYGEHREPTPEMLDGLDAMLVDLFDVGVGQWFVLTAGHAGANRLEILGECRLAQCDLRLACI